MRSSVMIGRMGHETRSTSTERNGRATSNPSGLLYVISADSQALARLGGEPPASTVRGKGMSTRGGGWPGNPDVHVRTVTMATPSARTSGRRSGRPPAPTYPEAESAVAVQVQPVACSNLSRPVPGHSAGVPALSHLVVMNRQHLTSRGPLDDNFREARSA